MKTKSHTDGRPVSLDHQVLSQLHALSQALDETAKQYVQRLQREITELSDQLSPSTGKRNFKRPSPKMLRQMTELLTALHIKPTKGRRKDLKRIDEVIGELENVVEG